MAEIVFIKSARVVATLRRSAADKEPEAGQIALAASAVSAAAGVLAEATAALNAAVADYFTEDGRPAWIKPSGAPCLPSTEDVRAACLAHVAFVRIVPPDEGTRAWIADALSSLPAGGLS